MEKVFYFYDDNSREDYIDIYDEEFAAYKFALNLPFGKKLLMLVLIPNVQN